ncbi:MAG: DNA repair protein RecO [Oscillospiraceae bacterium]|nr:DNA repair protein RecO [Oscillospiraceae bacterium]
MNRLITINGLVIGARAVGDADCYLDILTAEYGVIEVFAHAVRKLNSKNAGSTQLFSYAEFCLKISKARRTINSTIPKYNFHGLSRDIRALSLAAYFAEVVKHTTPEHLDVRVYNTGENVLNLFLIALYELQKPTAQILQIKAVFEFRLASLLGFMPDLRACEVCAVYETKSQYFLPESGNIYCEDCYVERDLYAKPAFLLDKTMLYTLRFITYSQLKKIFKFSLNQQKELSVISENYLLLHVDRNFKTLDYFKGVPENE